MEYKEYSFEEEVRKRKYMLTKEELKACKKINKGIILAIKKHQDIQKAWKFLLKKFLPTSSEPILLKAKDKNTSPPFEVYCTLIKEGRPHLFLLISTEVSGDIFFFDEAQFNAFDDNIYEYPNC